MMEETNENLRKKLQIYQQLFDSLNISSFSNSLTPASSSSLSSTLPTLTPPTPSTTPSTLPTFSKPNKRYIKTNEILSLTNLKKNDYNNLLVSKNKYYIKILLIIKSVSKILNDYLIIKIILTFFYSLRREIQMYLQVKEIES